MTTVSQMVTDRATAGSDYATALAALKAAWIALRKYDITLTNARVQALYATPHTLTGIKTRSFGQSSEWNPSCLRHGEYALTPEYLVAWEASADAAAQALISAAS